MTISEAIKRVSGRKRPKLRSTRSDAAADRVTKLERRLSQVEARLEETRAAVKHEEAAAASALARNPRAPLARNLGPRQELARWETEKETVQQALEIARENLEKARERGPTPAEVDAFQAKTIQVLSRFDKLGWELISAIEDVYKLRAEGMSMLGPDSPITDLPVASLEIARDKLALFLQAPVTRRLS